MLKTPACMVLFFAAAWLALGACTKPRARMVAFDCPDGYTFNVTYSSPNEPGDIVWFEDESGSTRLPREIAASGTKYSNDAMTFWSKGDEAMVMVGGQLRHQYCRAG
jgi:membrane-bound inhibitor of C-type lysozyme